MRAFLASMLGRLVMFIVCYAVAFGIVFGVAALASSMDIPFFNADRAGTDYYMRVAFH